MGCNGVMVLVESFVTTLALILSPSRLISLKHIPSAHARNNFVPGQRSTGIN